MAAKTSRKSLDQHLAEKAARKAECAARDEDTPEKVEWFKKGIARRRAEFGWTFDDA